MAPRGQRCRSAAARGPHCIWCHVRRREGGLLRVGWQDVSRALLHVHRGMVSLLGLNAGISRSFTFASLSSSKIRV